MSRNIHCKFSERLTFGEAEHVTKETRLPNWPDSFYKGNCFCEAVDGSIWYTVDSPDFEHDSIAGCAKRIEPYIEICVCKQYTHPCFALTKDRHPKQKYSISIGHFRVPPSLCFKTRVGAQPLIWKSFFILVQIKLIFTRKVVHLASFWKWGFLELRSGLLLHKQTLSLRSVQAT